jgi:heat shock protein HtpX
VHHLGVSYAEPDRNGWAFVLPEAAGVVRLSLVPSGFAAAPPRHVAHAGTVTIELDLPGFQPNLALRVGIRCRVRSSSDLQRQLHRASNGRASDLAIGGMLMLLAVCGFINGGEEGARSAVLHGSLTPDHHAITPAMMARRFGAKLLRPADAPALFAKLAEICRRARLARLPDLYCLGAPNSMNAYALGAPHNAAIVVTDGLLQRMSKDEVAGILAHEVAHIANNDRVAMSWATSLQQAVAVTALAGLTAKGRGLPAHGALAAFLRMAPAIGQLLFLALSRSRELDADARALDLIDHPQALVTALGKLEQFHAPSWFGALQAVEDGVARLLRSHPATSERVGLLVRLAS